MVKPLAICIVTETFHPVVGGGETQTRLLGQGLVARGCSVSVVTRRSDGALPATDDVGGLAIRRLPPVGRGQLKKWGLALSCVAALVRMRRRYDVVLVSGFRIVGAVVVLVGRLLGKGTVLKADSQGEMSGAFFAPGLAEFGLTRAALPFRLFLAARNWILRYADAFVAITPAVADELRLAGVEAAAIHVIPNGVDVRRFRPVSLPEKLALRRKLGLPERGRIVIYTGRLVRSKGLPLLLRVWSRLRERHEAATLLLVGAGGLAIQNCEDDLRAYVRAEGLERHVVFTGSVPDVSEYLQASDVFVLPTEDDAFPSAMIEAMSGGLPVVATPVGAIGSVIEDGRNGSLIEAGSFEQLYHAIDRLLTDDALAARLGEAARRSVQEHYSAEHVTEEYLDLLERTRACRGGTP